MNLKIVAIFLFMLFLAIGCVNVSPSNRKTLENESGGVIGEKAVPEAEPRLDDFLSLCGSCVGSDYTSCEALATGNSQLCGENPYCYERLALTTKNGELCERARDPAECYYRLAKHTGNGDLCVHVKEKRKESCYEKVALVSKDPGYCEKSEKPYFCYEEVAEELGLPKLCDKVAENLSEWRVKQCYYEAAVKSNKSEFCEKTESPQNCYSKIAYKTKDLTLCEKLNHEMRCKAVLTKNPDLCKESKIPDNCYRSLAEDLGRPDLCERLESHSFKRMCYADVSVKLKDINLCKKTDGYGGCVTEIALATNNSSLCEDAECPSCCSRKLAKQGNDLGCSKYNGGPAGDEDYCHGDAAKAGNLKACEKISKLNRGSLCTEAAVANRNPEFCEYLNDTCYCHRRVIEAILLHQ